MNEDHAIPSRGYLICSIERTGSGVLSAGLTQSGVAGRPLEYFSPGVQGQPWMLEILGSSNMVTGIDKILMAGATPNGVFGGKLHWFAFRHLAVLLGDGVDELAAGGPGAMLRQIERLPDRLPAADMLDLLRSQVVNRPKFTTAYAWFRERLPDLRLVRLTRRNMVARAISHWRALNTGTWHLSSGTTAAAPPPSFDLSKIHKLYVLGLFQDEMWQWFFRQHSISPHHVVYEDLVADYAGTLRQVTTFLGVHYPTEKFAPPATSVQSDALSLEWEQRYREESEKF